MQFSPNSGLNKFAIVIHFVFFKFDIGRILWTLGILTDDTTLL